MNAAILSMISGPLTKLVAGSVAAAGASLATKYGLDGQNVSAVVSGVMGLFGIGLSALTSTHAVKIAAVADMPGISVKLPDGREVSNATAASKALK